MGSCKGLVTAASRGLGYVAAEALAEKGCDLVISSRDPKELLKARRSLIEKHKVDVEYRTADLRVENDVINLIEFSVRRLGRLDVVVANYGNPSCEPCTLLETSWMDWIEASALYIASTAMISKMLIKINPVKVTLIVISSFTVLEPSPYLIVSDVVRSGLTRLVKILAREYPEKLKPISILLGSFRTPGALRTVSKIAERLGKDPEVFWKEKVEGISPLKRSGSLDEFKKLIAWLALESPEYLTGTSVLFDGATTRAVTI